MNSLKPVTRAEHFMGRAAGNPGAEKLTPITREELFLEDIVEAVEAGGGGGGQPLITATGILKGDGSGNVSAAVAGTDYVVPATIVNLDTATPTISPQVNTIYRCAEISSLTISQPPRSGAYMITFTSGSTATTITGASGILGLENFAPETNMTYEINVLDNRAVVGSWEVS